MELAWMGRYRRIVYALVNHTNSINRVAAKRADFGGGTTLTHQELQVLEALIEHEGENLIMADIASSLSIPQSSMTKITQQLNVCGLVERYKLSGNKKNIILKPSKKGLEFYNEYTSNTASGLFSVLFEKLEPFTDEQIETIADAILSLNAVLSKDSEEKLIKMEDTKR